MYFLLLSGHSLTYNTLSSFSQATHKALHDNKRYAALKRQSHEIFYSSFVILSHFLDPLKVTQNYSDLFEFFWRFLNRNSLPEIHNLNSHYCGIIRTT